MFVIDLTFAKKSTKDEMCENVKEMGMENLIVVVL